MRINKPFIRVEIVFLLTVCLFAPGEVLSSSGDAAANLNFSASAAGSEQTPEEPSPGQVWTDDNGIAFAWIPPGSFLMGSPPGEPWRRVDEGPVHKVEIEEGFWLGVYEVTQEEWTDTMGENPSTFQECGGSCPVETVSWNDAQRFVSRLNSTSQTRGYRLPTEAEWEYAARAGSGAPAGTEPGSVAWYEGNASGTPHPVGLKEKNAWGLYDTLGNVWEWCSDTYQAYPSGIAHSRRGYEEEIQYIRRGCSWSSDGRFCRVACRSRHTPESRFSSLGFRLAFSPEK